MSKNAPSPDPTPVPWIPIPELHDGRHVGFRYIKAASVDGVTERHGSVQVHICDEHGNSYYFETSMAPGDVLFEVVKGSANV